MPQSSPITIVDEPQKLVPALVPVCGCESAGSSSKAPAQFNADGSVVHGRVHATDVGACQINADVWRTKALSMGYDIDTWDGNVQMANYIYRVNGLKPWSSSQACWSK